MEKFISITEDLLKESLVTDKGGIEGPAGLANAVPLSEAVCNAGPLFD